MVMAQGLEGEVLSLKSSKVITLSSLATNLNKYKPKQKLTSCFGLNSAFN